MNISLFKFTIHRCSFSNFVMLRNYHHEHQKQMNYKICLRLEGDGNSEKIVQMVINADLYNRCA